MRILFHLNQVGFGGTEKAILTFCQNIDHEHFDVHLFINQPLSLFRRIKLRLFRHLSEKHRDIYTTKLINARIRLGQFEAVLGKERIHHGSASDFPEVCARLSPDNRSRASRLYDEVTVTRTLEGYYRELLAR